MELEWIATDPETLLLSHNEERSNVDDYLSRIEALRERGEGYTEVGWANRPYPYLALSFRGPYGVVHQWADEGQEFLLAGDGALSDNEEVVLPVLDTETAFTGEFVLNADHAWDITKAFIRSGSVEDLGEWCLL